MRRPVERLAAVEATRSTVLWAAALAFFVAGDLLTTGLGLQVQGTTEGHPLAARLVARFGVVALLPVKLLAVAGFYLLWRWLPGRQAVAVPAALALIGIAVTGWNGLVLYLAAGG